MLKIVNDHDIQGVGTGVLLEDYESVYPRSGRNWEKWLKGAYQLAFADTLIELRHYSSERSHPVSFVVEESQHWYTTAYEIFNDMKEDTAWEYHTLLETIAPYSTEQARQLHSADLLAYETYLMKSREIVPTAHGHREHLVALLQKDKAGRIWDAKALKTLKTFADEGDETEQGIR